MIPARLFPVEDVSTADDWYTPPWVFDALGLTFDLDVAAPTGGVPWIPARRCFDENADGLARPWEGTVWCNPPYSDPAPWCHRWVEHGNGFIILRADLSTSGPYAAFEAADCLFVPRKRMQFVNGHGERNGAVNFSTLILSIGPRADVLERLALHGAVRQLGGVS